MPYADAVDIVEEALGERKIMDGIEYVCFSDSVITNETVNPWRKFKLGAVVILEVGECKFPEIHN
jgi:hypothetical protein